MKMLSVPLALAATAGLLSGQAFEKHWFEDESVDYGVLFEHEDGAFAYAMGSGAAWFDYDGDGDEDLLVLSSAPDNGMFQNDGDHFTDVTVEAGLALPWWITPIGLIVADYDQDGLPDVYMCTTGVNGLLHNEGGFFVDKAPDVGMVELGWSSSASWADFDRDGDLDLYVGNYVRDLNFPYHYGEPNWFYENKGTYFVERAAELGIDNSGVFGPSVPGFPYTSPEGEDTAGCTLATCTLDFDEDGYQEIMVGNDFGLWVLPNAFYRNTSSGGQLRFEDVSTLIGFDTRPHYNMGIYPRDFDHDGDWDFYKSNLGDNVLLRNDDGFLVDGTYEAGPVSGHNMENGPGSALLTSWGIIWEDLDNDTWEDLIVVNGYIPAAGFIHNADRSPNQLWINQGDGTFDQVSNEASGLGDEGPGRCIAAADVNGDGLVDFYLNNNGANGVALDSDRSRLYINTGLFGAGNHWAELDLRGRFSNLEALGARLEATFDGVTLKRQVLGDPIFLGSPTRMVHLGLGSSTVVDLSIQWPSGMQQELIGLQADQRTSILESAVTVAKLYTPTIAGEMAKLQAKLENFDTVDHSGTVVFELRYGAGGPLFLTDSVDVTVGAGAFAGVSVDKLFPASLQSRHQGAEIEFRLHAFFGGSQDSERLIFDLP
ncbi:MAG: CRTAC1 family protein [Planctomycetota bacterium]|nr:CRTAC1 family protein [Planctomycetota bacterium]